jgi:hypothetical protein
LGLSAKIRDGSVAVKMRKALLSAGQVVNRIVFEYTLDSVKRVVVWKITRNKETEEIKYLSSR